MAQTPVSLDGQEALELGSEAASDHSDSEYTDVSTSPPSRENAFPEVGWLDMTDAYLNEESLGSIGHANLPVEAGRSRVSSEWLHILQQGNKRYALRDTARNTFRGSGFHDLDKSGDWKPDEESDTSPRPRKARHRKPLNVEDLEDLEDGDCDGKRPRNQSRTLSYEQGRKNGRSMCLQLQVSSKEGKEKLRALTKEQLSSKHYVEGFPQGDFANSISYLANDTSELPLMGRAGVPARRLAVKDIGMAIEHPFQNEEEIYENLLGHREARGCRDCYDIGMECSLIDDALSYPCQTCKEDDQDCILIIPSKDKRPCEQCNKKGLYCSYSHQQGEDVIAACLNCQNANLICIAGPTKSARIDDVLSSIGKDTKPKTSSRGQNRPQRPSMRSCKGKKPMSQSKKRDARLIAKKRSSASSKRGGRKSSNRKQSRTTRSHKPNPKPDSSLGDPKKSPIPGGKIMHITTSFCHPIHFNWIPPRNLPPSPNTPPKATSSKTKDSSFPCHFCTNPGLSYALAGLGTRRVEVIQWEYDATAGYEELDNGWHKAGEECTRMCVKCTMERVLICLCTDHIIRPIAGLDPRTFDFEGAIAGLLDQNLNRGSVEQEAVVDSREDMADVKWCSVCVEPAFFECCVTPPFTSSGRETSPGEDIGCGLLLCEVCALKMRGQIQHQRYSGGESSAAALTPPDSSDGGSTKLPSDERFKAVMTLDEHIEAASRNYFQYPDGLRADVCFLKSDGELMRRQGAEDMFAADGDELDLMARDQDFGFDGLESQLLDNNNRDMEQDLIDLTQL